MIEFERLRCLRTDHTGSECDACIEACATDAFVLKGKRLNFHADRCTTCGGCVGGCPTEAIAIDGFDENHFTLLFGQKSTLSCRENTPCLAVFGAEHLVVMALKSEGEIRCDLAHCQGCVSDPKGHLHQHITDRITQANTLLQSLGLSASLVASNEKPASDRRNFFGKLLSHATRAAVRPEHKPQAVSNHATPTPKRRILLANALEAFIADQGAVQSPLFAHISIDPDRCTGCQECVRFCPTKALSITGEQAHLAIEPLSCIGCMLCDLVCKDQAILPLQDSSLAQWMQPRTLVAFEWKSCQQCGAIFAAKADQPHCRPCSDFIADGFGDMFAQEFTRTPKA